MSITEELPKILAHVDRPGDFYVMRHTELLAPRIEVEGVGLIALPLLAAQAKRLIKMATRAPYGRGAETVVDTKVRRTWQIEASRIAIGGKHWAQMLARIVSLRDRWSLRRARTATSSSSTGKRYCSHLFRRPRRTWSTAIS
jgi:hypothetical protein